MEFPAALQTQIQDGKCALVLGAGASYGALHPDGKRIPSGDQLRDTLCDRFLGKEHRDLPLAQVSEYAISETSLADVQAFIHDLIEPFQPASFHMLIPDFNWRGIATLNYDLIVERAYQKVGNTHLKPFISDNQRVNDLLRHPDDRLLMKLHGSVSRADDPTVPLILTVDQFVLHQSGRANVYAEFLRIARENTLVFVGASLLDPDLRQLLLWIDSQETARPRSFLVTPSGSAVARRFFETKRITLLDGSFEEFLKQLDADLSGIARGVSTAISSLPVFGKLTVPVTALSPETRLSLEHDYDYVHAAMPAKPANATDFYKGALQGWSAIQAGLDCQRRVTEFVLYEAVLEEPPHGSYFFLLKAPAGAGKSVTLRRVAWEAAVQLGKFCLFLREGIPLATDAIVEAAEATDQRIYLFVDDIADRLWEIRRLLVAANRRQLKITLIGAERSNEWNVAAADFDMPVTREYELRPLDEREVKDLLNRLEANKALGTLADYSQEEREKHLLDLAQGQLLVALHEALLGKKFEDIVVDEYQAIIPAEAQSLYLSVCLLNRTGAPVRAGLISRLHKVPFEDFKAHFMLPLEHVVYAKLGRRNYDYEYTARHPYIAELVVRHILRNPDQLLERVLKIISAMNLSFDSDSQSFRDLINHKVLSDLLTNADHVHAVFDRAAELHPDNGHLFLHRALFEMWRDSANLERAAADLRRAADLMPGHSFVAHAEAQLERARAERAGSAIMREAHRNRAIKLLSELRDHGLAAAAGGAAASAYPEVTMAAVQLDRLQDAIRTPSSPDVIQENIDRADTAIDRGLQRFPKHPHLLRLEADLATLLNDDVGARAALEAALKSGIRNISLVKRLADIYERQGEQQKARDLLDKACAAVPSDKRLNFRFARFLLATGATPELIERHLRRSFTRGDKNYRAQLLFARQLYVDGKVDESANEFRELSKAQVSPADRRMPQEPILDTSSQPIWFSGDVVIAEYSFAKLRRDRGGDTVYVPQDVLESSTTPKLTTGAHVEFTLAFNFSGPVVTAIRPAL